MKVICINNHTLWHRVNWLRVQESYELVLEVRGGYYEIRTDSGRKVIDHRSKFIHTYDNREIGISVVPGEKVYSNIKGNRLVKDKEYVVIEFHKVLGSINIEIEPGHFVNYPLDVFTTQREMRSDKLKSILE